MVILILERVTPSLRGELTRWLLQPKTGVFVGKVSALVRDKLWDKVVASLEAIKPTPKGKRPGGIMVYSTNTEQGFAIRSTGQTDKTIEDFEGLLLVKSAVNA
jgi:CRISPR-associated protein Cas2